MKKREQGFLIRKDNGKIIVNKKKTPSILLNQLQVDLLESRKQFFSGRLLDAGCGEKPYSLLYDDLVSESIGCDIETCVHEQKYVDIFASVDNLPFEDARFDTILCTNVLEHVPEAGKAYKELARCLAPKGTLILITPFLYPLHEAPYDYYRYTVHGLRYLLRKNGLNVQCIIPLGGFGFMVVVYFNLIITRLLKIKPLTELNCFLQKVFYCCYKKIFFRKLLRGMGDKSITSIVSCGYFVIAHKD